MIKGKTELGVIVCGPAPGMLKAMVSMPGKPASSMAARSVHSPGVTVSQRPSPMFASLASPVEFTVKTVAACATETGPSTAPTNSAIENSSVPLANTWLHWVLLVMVFMLHSPFNYGDIHDHTSSAVRRVGRRLRLRKAEPSLTPRYLASSP